MTVHDGDDDAEKGQEEMVNVVQAEREGVRKNGKKVFDGVMWLIQDGVTSATT